MITTAVLLLLFTLICLTFSMGRAWSNVTLHERNALVFEGRHQGYGAYRLRKDHDRRIAVALGLTVGVLALLAAVPKVLPWFMTPATVEPPIPPFIIVDFITPPVPPDNPPPAKKSTITATITPKERSALVVPVDSVLIPPPDTLQVADPAKPASLSGSHGGGSKGRDSLLTGTTADALGGDTGPWPPFTVDELPVFPGGDAAIGPWVRKHLDLPPGLVGSDVVYVQFTVGRDGAVSDARALSGDQPLCKESAEQAIARMPRWKPARMNGHDVPCRLTLPIRFEVR